MNQKIFIACRVRPSNLIQTNKSISKSSPSKQSPKYIRSESPNIKDLKYSIFTSSCCNPKFKPQENPPQLVIASENPIKAQLLEKYIQSDDDLVKYRNSILGSVDMFEFDRVFGIKTGQEKLYVELCKEKVSQCINGHSSTFLFIGPNGGGKQFSFRGGDNNDKGIMMNAAEDLINLISISKQGARPRGFPQEEYDNFQLKTQIFCIANNEIIDLLAIPKKNSIARKQQQQQPISLDNTVEDIGSISSLTLTNSLQFRNLYRQTANQLISLSTDSERLIRSAHFIVRFLVYKNKENLSQTTFVKLNDFTKNSQQDLNILQKFLIEISSNKRGRILSNSQYFETQLVKVLSDTLNKLNDNSAIILANVESLPQQTKNSISALQFCHILRKKIQSTTQDSGQQVDKSGIVEEKQQPQSYLCQDIDEALNQIFQYSSQTKGLNEFERREWILNQEKKILQIENQLQQIDINDKQIQIRENKITEAKKFLRDLKKYPSQPNFQSTSNINIKDPQSESVDNDFQSLLTKYNQQKIVQLDPRMPSVSSLKNEEASQIADLKKSLMDKIDRTIQQESPQKNKAVKNTSQLNETKEEQRIFLAKLQQLEEGIKRRDRVIANYEIEINEQRKERDNEKDMLLRRLTKQELISKTQEELFEIIENLKIKLSRKRESYNSLMENFRVLEIRNQEDKKNFIEEKMEFDKQLEMRKDQYEEQKVRCTELQRLLDQTRKDMEINTKKNQALEQNFSDVDWRVGKLQTQLHEEQDVAKELKITTQIQEKKLEDYAIKITNLEDKLFKLKKKYEEDTTILKEERDCETQKNKKKTNNMKQKLRELQNQLQQLTQDGHLLQLENEKLQRNNINQSEDIQMRANEYNALHIQASQLQIENNKIKEQNADYDLLLKREADEVNKLQRLNNSQQEEIEQKNALIIKYEGEIDQLKTQSDNQIIELKDLSNQNQAQYDLISKLEQQNNMLQEIQNKEISQMEDKIEGVNRELIRLKEENLNLINNQNNLMNQLHASEQTIEEQGEKLARFKLINKQLKENIEELDERVKELIQEKNIEIRELQTVEFRKNSPPKIKKQSQYSNDYDVDLNQSKRSKFKDLMRNLEEEEEDEEEEYNNY